MTTPYSPRELSEIFTDIGTKLAGSQTSMSALDMLADIAVRRVPQAEYAGVTVGGRRSQFSTVAATDDLVGRTDQIQYDLRSGPCVDAIVANKTFNAADLRTDERWPVFGLQAAEL